MHTGSRYLQGSCCEGRPNVNALSCHQTRRSTLTRTDKDYTSAKRINRREFGMNHIRNFEKHFYRFFSSSLRHSIIGHCSAGSWNLFENFQWVCSMYSYIRVLCCRARVQLYVDHLAFESRLHPTEHALGESLSLDAGEQWWSKISVSKWNMRWVRCLGAIHRVDTRYIKAH